MKRDRYRELRSLLRPERLADDVEEELLAHLELRSADLEAGGLSPAEARAEALRRFGSLQRYRDETASIDEATIRERRRMEFLDTVRREAAHSLRSLMRAPLFTGVTVLTLGLGIGATTAIYTLLDSIVLRPLAYPEAGQLVQVNHAVPLVQEGQEWGNSVASYFHYSDNSRTLQDFGAARRISVSVAGDGEAEKVAGAVVSASLFDVLGGQAVRGRLFTAEDDTPGRDRVAVISHEFWQSRYHGDPAVLNGEILVNAEPVTVVGILQPGFSLPEYRSDVWLPLQLDRTAEPQNSHVLFTTYARLRPGATVQTATAELESMKRNFPALFPTAYTDAFFERSGFTPVVHPLRSMVLGRAGGDGIGVDRVLWMLLGAVSLVLLIACANVANLMLVRWESQRRELSVRAALGAGRVHLASHHIAESALLTCAATALGLTLAWSGVKLLVITAPETLPRLDEVGLSMRGLGFAAAISVLTALVFGLAPLVRGEGSFADLREGGRGSTPSRRRHAVRSGLVIAQVAMALVLLASGALMLRTFLNLRDVDSGVNTDNVLTFAVELPYAAYQEEARIFRTQQELIQRLQSLPGVRSAGATTSLPFTGGAGCATTTGAGAASDGCVPTIFVLPGYFEALEIDVRGESISWQDVEQRRPTAVISRALAERMWPGEDPIGRQVISYQSGPPWFTIVGVAEDVLADGLDRPPVQAVYYPTRRPEAEGYFGPHGIGYLHFVVRSESDAQQMIPAVREVLRDIDPQLPLADARTLEDVVMTSERMARTTFTMMLLGIAAAIALFLSAVGLYGVIAWLVTRRRAEIGVRIALGARVTRVARLVVMQSVRLTAVGIAVGIAGALFVTRTLSALVWGVAPTDIPTLLAVSALLLVIAVVASALPAWRAARVPPSETLRSG